MNRKVLSYIKAHNLIEAGDTVTVGLSGGADSVALLLSLLDLKDELGISVKAAHLNHMLRGDESNRDEEFVRNLCHKLNVECVIKHVNVLEISKNQKLSVELAARQARYDFFDSLDSKIATAHSADDNLETIIYNLSRGTGIKGLCGIPAKRGRIIRPLLECTREENEHCCIVHGVEFVTDSSNLTDDYSRNKIRHLVVPVLKEINSGAVQNAIRSSKLLIADNDFLFSEAMKAYDEIQNLSNNVDELLKLHPAILSRVLKIMAEKHGVSLDSRHIDLMVKAVLSKIGCVQLAPDLYFKVNNLKAEFCEKPIAISFKTYIYFETDKEKINNLLLKSAIDYDKISGELKLRNRCAGDKITIFGRDVTKSLKKLFNEAEIPLHLRDTWPIAVDDNGVVWVYRLGVDKRVALSKETQNAAVFTVLENI